MFIFIKKVVLKIKYEYKSSLMFFEITMSDISTLLLSELLLCSLHFKINVETIA